MQSNASLLAWPLMSQQNAAAGTSNKAKVALKQGEAGSWRLAAAARSQLEARQAWWRAASGKQLTAASQERAGSGLACNVASKRARRSQLRASLSPRVSRARCHLAGERC